MFQISVHTFTNLSNLVVQKLSLLVTEAYKDAHQKSVEVSTSAIIRVSIFPISCFLVRYMLVCPRHAGHERKNEQSGSELRNARRDATGFRRQSQVIRDDGFNMAFQFCEQDLTVNLISSHF